MRYQRTRYSVKRYWNWWCGEYSVFWCDGVRWFWMRRFWWQRSVRRFMVRRWLQCGRCQRVLARFDCIQLEYILFCGIRYTNVGCVSFRQISCWCCCFWCGGFWYGVLWCGGFLSGCLGYDSGKFDVDIMRTTDFKSAPAAYSIRRSIRSGGLFDTAVYAMRWSIRCGDLFDDAAVYSMRRSIK